MGFSFAAGRDAAGTRVMFVNVKAEDVIAKLEPGEEIVWAQRGPVLRLSAEWFIMSFVLLIFLVAWLGLLFVGIHDDRTDTWTVVLVLGGICALITLALSQTINRFSAGLRTVYVITDRAALIIEAVKPVCIRRFNQESVARRWTFGSRIFFPPTTLRERFVLYYRSFYGVRDMAAAEAALEQIVRHGKG
ncbi:MAG: hypothetical protein RIC14_05065 [Filomicrobium sp.]